MVKWGYELQTFNRAPSYPDLEDKLAACHWELRLEQDREFLLGDKLNINFKQ